MEEPTLFDIGEFIQEPIENETELDMLTHYLGEEDAKKVVAAFGSTTIYIPANESGKRYGELTAKVGSELANKMVQAFAGEELYIPRNYYSEIHAKHKSIRARFYELQRQGKPSTSAIITLSQEHCLSDRHIRRILK